MTDMVFDIIERLVKGESLALEEYEALIRMRTPETQRLLREQAEAVRKRVYGNAVYTRGLIEVSNYCKNDCLYCGIRRSNRACSRYRLTEEEILECCRTGYDLGFRTFVMQGGEDPYFTDEVLTGVISQIKERYPSCAVTLSLGERSYQSYRALREAGADRYLLRHETADPTHYKKLHPPEMSYENRMRCLRDLRELGYQVGCGFMVGSPGQTPAMLAQDLKFIEGFRPDMCGVGPFIPHRDTPFAKEAGGDAELTCYLLSIIRLIHPPVLLPATTALGTVREDGRQMGILSGANVVMPNLSPLSQRWKYELYDGKLHSGDEAAESGDKLAAHIAQIGYQLVMDRGDVKHINTSNGEAN